MGIRGENASQEELIKNILTLHQNGKCADEIAPLYNTTVSTIYRILKKGSNEDEEIDFLEEDVVRLYNKGVDETEIAKRLNIPVTTATNKLKAHFNESYKNRRRILEEEKRKEERSKGIIIDLYKKGKSAEEIQRQLEISESFISKTIINYIKKEEEIAKREARKREEQLRKEARKEREEKKSEQIKEIEEPIIKEPPKPKKTIKIMTKEELDTILTQILSNGITIKGWELHKKDSKTAEKLRERLEDLRVIANISKRTVNGFSPDTEFIEILDIVSNPRIISGYEKYQHYLKNYLKLGGFCDQGKTDLLSVKVFNGNTDLEAYILSGMNLSFGEYDSKKFSNMKEKYGEKIENHFKLLHVLESDNPELINKLREKINKTTPTVPEF